MLNLVLLLSLVFAIIGFIYQLTAIKRSLDGKVAKAYERMSLAVGY